MALLLALAWADPVVVASHPIARGSVIEAGDLEVADLDPRLVPGDAGGAVEALVGRRVRWRVEAGEPIRQARLVAPSVVAPALGEGLRLVSVPTPDAAYAAPGARVDVLARVDGEVRTVVEDVVVGRTSRPELGAPRGRVRLVVAPEQALALARAAVDSPLWLTLRAPG